MCQSSNVLFAWLTDISKVIYIVNNIKLLGSMIRHVVKI